jgi:hypothetical protein
MSFYRRGLRYYQFFDPIIDRRWWNEIGWRLRFIPVAAGRRWRQASAHTR